MIPRPLWIGALVLFALASPLRADYLPAWTYSWSSTTTTLGSDTGPGSVILTPDPGTNASPVGSTQLVAASIQTSSAATSTLDSLNTSGAYNLSLTVTDTASGLSHTFDFGGKLSGTFGAGSANLTNSFTTAGPLTFDLGSTAYTAALNSYVHPGPPGASNAGAFGAIVTVAAAAGGNPNPSGFGTPEPSSLLLCSLGATGCALAGWRRRRTRTGSPAAV